MTACTTFVLSFPLHVSSHPPLTSTVGSQVGKANAKGEMGEAMILADLQRQGHGIAIPFGHDLPFDLIVVRNEDGAPEKVQCKYTTSCGRVVAKVLSTSAWVNHRYTKDEVDWVAVYDATTQRCFYLPSAERDGQAFVDLRSVSAANGQAKGVRIADDFTDLTGSPGVRRSPRPATPLPLPLDPPPE